MRSRDGNHSLTLTVSTIIFILGSLALHAGEYLISYRYTVQDAILINETLDISKSMQKCLGRESASIFFPNENNSNLEKTIATNREEFTAFLHKLGLIVEHKEQTINAHNSSITRLTLKTTCFKVDFNDTLVKISALK